MSFCLFSSLCVAEPVQIETPPMGWNSFDSYGVYLHHEAAVRNIDAMAERYLPYGYEYFVIDAGWFGEVKLQPGTIYPAEKHAESLHINRYGLLQPSKTYFPHGLKVLADRAHAKGLKFGVHIMRGIPKVAVQRNTRIKGTKYRARDIADTVNVCSWCPQNYGIDMSKPGAQEFYNSFIDQLASWGVDFIKADDIVPHPREVEALVKAVAQCGRPIVLSLSPGGTVDPDAIGIFSQANMLRITHDIWDDQTGIDSCFEAWRRWQGKQYAHFFYDMDMIPFGELQIMSPLPEGLTGKETKNEIVKQKAAGKLSNVELLSGKGWHRWSGLSHDQMLTFITMRALAASPLMIGGDLVSMDDFAYALLTNREMIACNQNGVMASLIYEKGAVEVWYVASRNDPDQGWFGVFNRDSAAEASFNLLSVRGQTNLNPGSKLESVWDQRNLRYDSSVEIAPNSVVFIKFER